MQVIRAKYFKETQFAYVLGLSDVLKMYGKFESIGRILLLISDHYCSLNERKSAASRKLLTSLAYLDWFSKLFLLIGTGLSIAPAKRNGGTGMVIMAFTTQVRVIIS